MGGAWRSGSLKLEKGSPKKLCSSSSRADEKLELEGGAEGGGGNSQVSGGKAAAPARTTSVRSP